MINCRDCKHWGYYEEKDTLFKECMEIQNIGFERTTEDLDPGMMAYTRGYGRGNYNGREYDPTAALVTHANFGCVMGESKITISKKIMIDGLQIIQY